MSDPSGAGVEAIKAELKRVGARNDPWVRCSGCGKDWTDDHKHPEPDDPMDVDFYFRQEGGTIWTDYDGMAAWVADLLATRDAALAAASRLLAKIDELMPAINGAFQMQAMHGFKYHGPNMADELRELRAALAPRGAAKEAK